MADKLEIVERTEPITIEEVFDFIDDTSIGKMDAHELKSRIADMKHEVRANAIDEFAEKLDDLVLHSVFDSRNHLHECIHDIAEQLKAGGNHE